MHENQLLPKLKLWWLDVTMKWWKAWWNTDVYLWFVTGDRWPWPWSVCGSAVQGQNEDTGGQTEGNCKIHPPPPHTHTLNPHLLHLWKPPSFMILSNITKKPFFIHIIYVYHSPLDTQVIIHKLSYTKNKNWTWKFNKKIIFA